MSTEYRPTSSRVFNRQSVQRAIKSTQQRLKRYNNRCPENGLVVFCGLAVTDQTDGKERQVTVDLEPSRPIRAFVYRCDNRFHTEHLSHLLVDEGEDRYGFLVVDGNGTLFGLLQGSSRQVLYKFNVDLPNKHGRGGQSALRFDRIRLQKRHEYLRRVAELSAKFFIENNRPNVKGLVFAGSADLKDDLLKSKLVDKRLLSIFLKTVDVSYGGMRGFHQAVDQSAETLGSVKLMREKQLLESFMEEVSRDSGKYCFSVEDTLHALEMGAVEQLIVWENLSVNRYELVNTETGEETVLHLTQTQEAAKDRNGYFRESETGHKLDFVKKEPLLDWICENYKTFGCNLGFVSDPSSLGAQFVLGFGGIGGLLRWKVDFGEVDSYKEDAVTDNGGEDSESEEDGNGTSVDEYGFDDGDFGF